MDFHREVLDVQKQLKVQRMSELKINEQIIEKLENDGKELRAEIDGLKEEIVGLKLDIANVEKDKQSIVGQRQKLEEMLRKSKKQSEKAARDLKRRLEESDRIRNLTLTQHTDVLNSLKNEIFDVKTKLKEERAELAACRQNLHTEKVLRAETLEKHRLQNEKLADLQKFFGLTLEENDDDYVDSLLGEDRTAIFAKISFLLSKIPVVE
ncbi:hypothetical protein L596_011087 [Steinernema carpocapsae]|nr:hypothetical protein L596_011087 [Steinernema carpocapsae]